MTQRMNQSIKARWVAALRSGEYAQGRRFLRDGATFCCLGILCDLHAKEGLGHWKGERYETSLTIPPTVVAEWAGLPEEYPNPMISIGGRRLFAADHNDRGRTFAEIADAIEAQL